MDLCHVGPFISDMQLKVFVTEVVEPNVLCFYLCKPTPHPCFGFGLTWITCKKPLGYPLGEISLRVRLRSTYMKLLG